MFANRNIRQLANISIFLHTLHPSTNKFVHIVDSFTLCQDLMRNRALQILAKIIIISFRLHSLHSIKVKLVLILIGTSCIANDTHDSVGQENNKIWYLAFSKKKKSIDP